MRYSPRIFAIALLDVLILLFWMGAPRWVQAERTIYAVSISAATNDAPLQGSTAPDKLVQAETPEPTRAPRPTSTPIAIPPPSDPGTIQLMVIFGILVVLVVIFGLLLNRNQVF
jgi:hypothetical protein